jgi:glycerol-3-phosphate acyltransferase PlsY
VACLAGWSTIVAAAVFGVSFLIWRIVSLSSILASLAFAACEMALLWPTPFAPDHWSLTAFSLVVPALIILRHRGNITRLMRGEEPKYTSKEAPPEPPEQGGL